MKHQPLAKQDTSLPTRKVAAFAFAAIATAAVQSWVVKIAAFSEWLSFLNSPETQSGVPIIVGFLVAWLVSDRQTVKREKAQTAPGEQRTP